jgi:hypothetical protein
VSTSGIKGAILHGAIGCSMHAKLIYEYNLLFHPTNYAFRIGQFPDDDDDDNNNNNNNNNNRRLQGLGLTACSDSEFNFF